MLIYQLLLGIAVMLALISSRKPAKGTDAGQLLSLIFFGLFYIAIAGLRYEVGGDWSAYLAMQDRVRLGTFAESLTLTDPGFGLLLYLSASIGSGVYLVNAVCAGILYYGIVRASRQTREPWLAVAVAVPYLMIVVGMGYIRQAAAIGLILTAIDSVRRGRIGWTLAQLLAAMLFHSTSIVVWPFFAMALANRNKLRILLLATGGTAIMLTLLSSRLSEFSAGYIESEYGSGGAFVRLLMGLIPSVVLLVSFRRFEVGGRARSIWIGFAMANVLAMLSLLVSPSSTAVDRLALYFSSIQLAAFGSIGELLGFSSRSRLILRVLVGFYAVTVLFVWLVYATHADSWVPYKSVMLFL